MAYAFVCLFLNNLIRELKDEEQDDVTGLCPGYQAMMSFFVVVVFVLVSLPWLSH